MCSSSLAGTPELQLTAELPWTGECWIPPKKDIPRPRAKEKPQQEGTRVKITFRIKPHTYQRHLEDSDKTLCTTGDPTETEPGVTLSVWVSPAEVWVRSGLLQGQGHRMWQCMNGTFWRTIVFITSTIVLWSNSREGTQPHSRENWIKDLLSMVLPIKTRPCFPHSLSHQETSINLSSLPLRGQTEWKPQS